MKAESKNKEKTFSQRLDFYWQFIAVYAIALIIIAIMRGAFAGGDFSIFITGPEVILLGSFIILSLIALSYNAYKNRKIVIGRDYIIFSSRFRKRKFGLGDIKTISFGKERRLRREGRAIIKIIKISVAGKKRIIRIRPSSYWDEKELVRRLADLKRNLTKERQ